MRKLEIYRKVRLLSQMFKFLVQDGECVTAMKSVPPGEIMCRVHIADRSDKAPATKGIDSWKCYLDNQYRGYKFPTIMPLTLS